MTAKCPRCRGTKMIGRGKNRGPCPACNSAAGGVGDKVAGAGQRAVDRLLGRRLDVEGRTTTSRDHRLAPETVRTRAPRKKPAAAKKKAPAKKSTTPATVRGPACDTCGQGGTLRMTSAGLHHVGGCPPASDGGA